jgi:hypothetical protein
VGIRNHEGLVALDREGTDRTLPGNLGLFDPHLGLEPDPRRIDQANQSDGNSRDPGGQPYDVVEGLLGGSIQDAVAPEGFDPRRFVRRQRRMLHQTQYPGKRFI